MLIKRYLSFLLVLLPLINACSNQAFQQSSLTQKTSTLQKTVTFTPAAIRIPDATPTQVLIPETTSQNFPTQALSTVNVGELPNLRDVAISSEDFENLKNIDALHYFKLICITDVTNELGNSCLWDCVKYFYSLENSTLTIMLLRAGDHQKAESTLEAIKRDFLKSTSYFEYSVSDIPTMPSGSWAMVIDSSIKEYMTGAAGIAHGNIVILVTYSRIGGDDGMDWAIYPVEFLNVQIQKLESAGYTK